ncbi:hypothetical protein [Streptosporangium sandarakinum]|uniref:hypothetical protein n=1 Tax=Streptosporangium sandarakinum TaxID=1260955 RepID=UPI0033AFF30B
MRLRTMIGLVLAALLIPLTAPASQAETRAAAFDPNPTISGPGVPAPHYAQGARGVYAPNYLPGCPYQRVCVAVLDYQDDRINTWKIWDLYQCGKYSLNDWRSRGWIRNNQSGGAVAVRMNSASTPLTPSHPVANQWRDVDWEPAWYFKPC